MRREERERVSHLPKREMEKEEMKGDRYLSPLIEIVNL